MSKQLYIVEYSDSENERDWVAVVWEAYAERNNVELLKFAMDKIEEESFEEKPTDLRVYPVAIADGKDGTYNVAVMEQ